MAEMDSTDSLQARSCAVTFNPPGANYPRIYAGTGCIVLSLRLRPHGRSVAVSLILACRRLETKYILTDSAKGTAFNKVERACAKQKIQYLFRQSRRSTLSCILERYTSIPSELQRWTLSSQCNTIHSLKFSVPSVQYTP